MCNSVLPSFQNERLFLCNIFDYLTCFHDLRLSHTSMCSEGVCSLHSCVTSHPLLQQSRFLVCQTSAMQGEIGSRNLPTRPTQLTSGSQLGCVALSEDVHGACACSGGWETSGLGGGGQNPWGGAQHASGERAPGRVSHLGGCDRSCGFHTVTR